MNNKANQTSFKKGHKHTKEVLEKIAICNRGKRLSPKTEFRKGQSPWNKGRGTYKNCLVCNEKIWVENNVSERKKFCSKACLYNSGIQKNTFQKGEKHPAYIDGNSKNLYTSEFKPSLKREIRKRDNFTCQLCGVTEEEYLKKHGKVLAVNHIDFNKENCSKDNLNTLCVGCNTKINWDRSRWTGYFRLKLNTIEL